MPVHAVGMLLMWRQIAVVLIIIGVSMACCFCSPGRAFAEDVSDLDCNGHFNPFMPTLVLKYEVAYRLFWLDLMHLADAFVYATDGEWFNEATGEWRRAYLLVFHLDTLEESSEIGTGHYSIHNRLATILLKPTLEPLIFVKRDYMHVDTFHSKIDIHNAEYFSVEAGKNDYIKKDYACNATSTNMPYFAKLVDQRKEVFRFMKTVAAIYAGKTNDFSATNNFTVSIFTDNAYVPFTVDIYRKFKLLDMLNNDYKTIYFTAEPARGYHGKGRNLSAWIAPFNYMAEMAGDEQLISMAGQTFEMGMIPLMADFGLKLGTVRCSLVRMSLESVFDSND